MIEREVGFQREFHFKLDYNFDTIFYSKLNLLSFTNLD